MKQANEVLNKIFTRSPGKHAALYLPVCIPQRGRVYIRGCFTSAAELFTSFDVHVSVSGTTLRHIGVNNSCSARTPDSGAENQVHTTQLYIYPLA
jgi:hypothetical protein